MIVPNATKWLLTPFNPAPICADTGRDDGGALFCMRPRRHGGRHLMVDIETDEVQGVWGKDVHGTIRRFGQASLRAARSVIV